jgi:hypothetical protein
MAIQILDKDIYMSEERGKRGKAESHKMPTPR